MKLQDWVGREIEYRSSGNLFDNGDVYRGRIIEIDDRLNQYHGYYTGQYAMAIATHQTSFEVIRRSINNNYAGTNRRHHSTISYRSKPYFKYAWQPVNKNLKHLVRWSGNRWKCIGILKFSFIYGWICR